jgi:hypothetical protein
MNRSTLAHTVSLLDRIARTDTRDAMRVAAFVRVYMHELAARGALAGDDYDSFSAVLRQWHADYGLPWLGDAGAALALLLSDKE